MTESPIIQSRQLTHVYRSGAGEVVGVDRIDMDIEKGEMVVLKGRSGSGKSTLLSLIGGLDTPVSGFLKVAGYDMRKRELGRLTRFRRQIVGMVFQTFNLMPTLNVMENVCLPAMFARKPFAPTEKKAMVLLEGMNLEKRKDHFPYQLSGGEMQRTAIARALINDPEIILADEPTGNLDSKNGRIVIDILARLNREQNRTVIVATHSNLADSCATMEILLKDGRRVKESNISE